MATVQTPEGKFGQWNMQRREAKINKWQSDVGMLDEKIDVVKNNIARHTAALQYHQSKGFFRKLFTFAWFSMWWNRRKLDKFNRKSREWIAHKQMIVAKQMIAQRKFEKKYGREVAYGHGGKIVTRINEYGKLEDREANGRTKGQRKVERAEFGYKNADRNVYLSTPSALPEFIAQTKDGKETYHYDHYNSIDRTVEINTNAGIERFVSDPARGLIRYESTAF